MCRWALSFHSKSAYIYNLNVLSKKRWPHFIRYRLERTYDIVITDSGIRVRVFEFESHPATFFRHEFFSCFKSGPSLISLFSSLKHSRHQAYKHAM